MKEIDIEEKEMLLHGNKYFIHIPKGKVDSKTGLKASEGWDFDKIPDVRQFRDGKKAKKLKTDNIKLINISDVNIIHKGKEKTPFIILPDDVECAELNDMTYCVQKDFDGKNSKWIYTLKEALEYVLHLTGEQKE